VIHLAVVKES